MQQEGHDNQELCINGCGFFGSAASGGMCSVCWKKTLSNQQAQTIQHSPSSTPATTTEEETAPTAAPVESVAEPSPKPDVAVVEGAAAASGEEKKPVQKNKKRCWECKKKVGYTGIECRCGYVFCSAHRYEDQHTCTFDFKALGREMLAKQNPGGGAFSKVDKL